MNGFAILVALSAVGVDYGWQPTGDGELEYIIQIEPALLDALLDGEDILSEIHPDVSGVRRFRIRVGDDKPPREGSLPPAKSDNTQESPVAPMPPEDKPAPSLPDSGNNFDPGVGFPANPDNIGFPVDGNRPSDEGFPTDQFPADLIPPPDKRPAAAPPLVTPPAGSETGERIPMEISPDPFSEALPNQPAAFTEPVGDPTGVTGTPDSTPMATAPDTSPDNASITEAAKPWATLTLVGLLLFGSVGLNLYLGWITRGIYGRYQILRDQMRSTRTAHT